VPPSINNVAPIIHSFQPFITLGGKLLHSVSVSTHWRSTACRNPQAQALPPSFRVEGLLDGAPDGDSVDSFDRELLRVNGREADEPPGMGAWVWLRPAPCPVDPWQVGRRRSRVARLPAVKVRPVLLEPSAVCEQP
jgi:hypothetical protein